MFKKFFYRPHLKTHIFNSSWLLITQGVRLLSGFFVGLWIARYLGPTDFGTYNYVTSFVLIFSAIASFGTNERVITEIAQTPSQYVKILNSAFYIRLAIGIFIFITSICVYSFAVTIDEIFRYVIIVIPVVIFQAFDLIELFYRATINEKRSAYVRIAQIIVSSIIKIQLIRANASLVYFFYVFTFDYVSFALMIYLSYRKNEHDDFIFKIPDQSEIKRILKICWPLMIMGIASSILSRVDNILIGHFMSKAHVGYYSASSRITELLVMVPSLIMTANYSIVLRGKNLNNDEYFRRFRILSFLLRWGCILISIFLYLFADSIVHLLYGDKYRESVDLLRVSCFTIVLIEIAFISTYWYIAENLGKLLMVKVVCAGISSVLLDLIFIPKYGAVGVIYSTLITYFLFYYLFDLAFKKTRQCFYINSDLFYFLRWKKLF